MNRWRNGTPTGKRNFLQRAQKPILRAVRWKKITMVGVGLLGGSLGLAIRRRNLAGQAAGYVRRAASIRDCERAGALDFATTDLCAAIWDADLVILCTPLAQMKPLVRQMLPALKRGAIVTDVGSVKDSVVRELESLVAKTGAHFVGSHPMAGSEKTGVFASHADLFTGAICVTTPTRKTNAAALRRVERFWKSLGCRMLRIDPRMHDKLVSRSSHLPQLVAAALAHLVLDPKSPKSQAALCAGGFRDTTRIASGSPEMWRDIAIANRAELSITLDAFVRQLQSLQGLLRSKKGVALRAMLTEAKFRRDSWLNGGSSE
jgi:prephenate dehydrogenase